MDKKTIIKEERDGVGHAEGHGSQTSVIPRYEYVDALRGWAVLGVLMVHVGQCVANLPLLLQSLTGAGKYGVTLFYVLSAFTLCLSLESRSGREPRYFRNYFIRRFFRIAPLFYGVIAFNIIAVSLGFRNLATASDNDPLKVIAGVLFLNGWVPEWINSVVAGGWSIAVETNFYLLLPFLFLYIKTPRTAIWTLLLTILIGRVLYHVAFQHPLIEDKDVWYDFIYYSLPNHLPDFLVGICCYLLLKNARTGSSGLFGLPSVWNPVLWLGALLAISAVVESPQVLLPHVSVSLAFGVILLALAFLRTPSYLLVNPLSIRLGKISYSVYLLHFAVLNVAVGFTKPAGAGGFLLLFTVVLLVTSAVSTLTYWAIELPGQALGKRIIALFDLRNNASKL